MKKWIYIIGAFLFFLPLCLRAQADFMRPASPSAYDDTLDERAKTLYDMGRDKEAIRYFKMAKARRDSVQLQLLTKQTEQVKQIHNVHILQKENERKAYFIQVFILSFLGGINLIIIGYLVYIYHTRKKLKHEEAEMREMTREVESVNLAKDHFISNINGSIAQPLDKVVASSLLLSSEQELDNVRRNELSDIINKTSVQLMKLINDILDLSRLESGMMKFVLGDIELFSFVRDTASKMCINKDEKIEVECPQNALCWLRIDGSRLLVVFQNLFAYSLFDGNIRVVLEPNAASGEVLVKVYHTALANFELSQELIVLNEVNRMIVNHFGGLYESRPDEPIPYVYLTLKGRVTRLEA